MQKLLLSLTHTHTCARTHTQKCKGRMLKGMRADTWQDPLELPPCRRGSVGGMNGRDSANVNANPHVAVLVPLSRALMHKV